MKASTSFNDLIGTVAADTKDGFAAQNGEGIKAFEKFFNIDKERFEVIGISLYGTFDFSASLICVDKVKSKNGKKHIVRMSLGSNMDGLDLFSFFKRIEIVLYSSFNTDTKELDCDEEIKFSDFHSPIE